MAVFFNHRKGAGMRSSQYYDRAPIMEIKDTNYYIIFGERSNGKTYAFLEEIIKSYCEEGKTGVVVRRWETDISKRNGDKMFAGHVANGLVEKYSDGKWTGVSYLNRGWYLTRENEKGEIIKDKRQFASYMSISATEHNKSVTDPDIGTILFDEMIPLKGLPYLSQEEDDMFLNTISTLIRGKGVNDVNIFLCGNTNNKYNNPYFKHWNLKNVTKMKPGDIDIYKYPDIVNPDGTTKRGTQVVIEYTEPFEEGKESDSFFSFDNDKSMIIDGGWDTRQFPHLPKKYTSDQVVFTFYIEYEDTLLESKIINDTESLYMYINYKYSPLKEKANDLIYTQRYDPRPNFHRNMVKGCYKIDRKLYSFFAKDKVYYRNDDVGDIVFNYIQWCKQTSL